jgi:thioredoxin 1
MSFNEMINSETPVLVDFFATWCGPCKVMAPELEKLKKMHGDDLNVIKIDVDQNPAAAQHYQISGVPTLILFKKGEIVWRQSGVVPATQLSAVVKQHA